MSETEFLSCVEIEPDNPPARYSVIWLHGLGADGHDFEPIVPHLGLDPELPVRFIFPHAPQIPVTINMGMVMPAWYDITTLELRRDTDEQGILRSADQVRALIDREHARGIAHERIVMAGFSQGGAIAFHVALRLPHRLAGIMALSTYVVLAESLDSQRHEANATTPIFQAHGTMDPMVQLERGEASRRKLEELGYAVEWKSYPMGHEVCPAEIRDIGVWLGERLVG